jgi:glycosyltransferase involved in cell wall biosynthesis
VAPPEDGPKPPRSQAWWAQAAPAGGGRGDASVWRVSDPDQTEDRRPDTARAPRVLVVGQGEPARGGIPTFIRTLLDDPWLRERARLSYLNTTHEPTRPGAATLANLRWAVEDWRRVRRAARGVDVVHLNLAPAPLLPLVRAASLARAARSAGARVVLHAHSGRLHIAARSPAYRLGLRALVRWTDVIVVVSADGARTVRAAGGAAELLPNAVDTSAFGPARRDADRPAIAFVGTICERKGLDDLREALLRLEREERITPASVRVRLVGDARQEGPGVFERVRDDYAASGLDWVEFTGALPPEDVREILATSDVFCLPSHWEGMPISMLEAMAAGAAVVATRVGDIPAVLEDGAAGIVVDVRSPEQLAEALGGLLADADGRRRLGEAARAAAVSRYDRRAMTGRLLAIYRRLAYSM